MTNVIYTGEPVIGYGEGVLQGELPEMRREDNNDWFYIGPYRFNVHPFRQDLHGWPVRWIETQEDYGDGLVWVAVQGRSVQLTKD